MVDSSSADTAGEAGSAMEYRLERAGGLMGARALALVELDARGRPTVLGSWGLGDADLREELEGSTPQLEEALASRDAVIRTGSRQRGAGIAVIHVRERVLLWALFDPPQVLGQRDVEILRELADAAWALGRGGRAEPPDPEEAERGEGDGSFPASLVAAPLTSSATTLGAYVILDGRLRYANPFLAGRLGYEPGELLGRSALEIVHPDDRPRVARQIRERIERRVGTVRYTFRLLARDGEVVPVEAHGSRVMWEGAPALAGVLVDVSRRTGVLDALRASERRFAEVVAVSRDATVGLDEDDVVILFNPAAESLLGLAASEALGRPIGEVLPELGAACPRGEEGTAARPSRTIRVRPPGRAAFDAEIWAAHSRAEGGGFRVCMIRDVTGQRRREEERQRLLRLERDERFLAELSHVHAEFVSDLTRQLVDARTAPGELLRVATETVIPVACDYAVCYPVGVDDAGMVAAAGSSGARQRLLEDPPALPDLPWAERPDGWVCGEDEDAPAPLERFLGEHRRRHGAEWLVLVPILDDGLRAVLVLGHLLPPRDPQRRAEIELGREIGRTVSLGMTNTRLYRDAETAARLRDQVLAVVSHDLRSPLNVVDLTTDALLRHWPTTDASADEVRKQLLVMQGSARRARRLVQDLHEVAQIQKGTLAVDPVPCDPADLLVESFQAYQPLAREKGIQLILVPPPDAPPILADPERILQVLANLLDNALRHTPPEREVRLRLEALDDHVRFEVADQGEGIPESEQAWIFEWFARGRSGSNVGTGLGLAIAAGFVEAHGGSIGVHSAEGQGATFHFTIPTHAPPDDDPEPGS